MRSRMQYRSFLAINMAALGTWIHKALVAKLQPDDSVQASASCLVNDKTLPNKTEVCNFVSSSVAYKTAIAGNLCGRCGTFLSSSSKSSRVRALWPSILRSAHRELTGQRIIVMVMSSWALLPSIEDSACRKLAGRVIIVKVISS